MSLDSKAEGRETPGWTIPQPERIPRPTVAPAALALGAALLAFGSVTSPLLSLLGGALAAGAVVVWVREVHHEHTR